MIYSQTTENNLKRYSTVFYRQSIHNLWLHDMLILQKLKYKQINM